MRIAIEQDIKRQQIVANSLRA